MASTRVGEVEVRSLMPAEWRGQLSCPVAADQTPQRPV